MSTYNEDLLYAKKIVAIRDACIDNRMGNKILSRVVLGSGMAYWDASLNHKTYVLTLGSPKQNDSVCTTTSYVTNKSSNHLLVTENYEPYQFELIGNYSEEYHFQNSLIYDESVNRRILLANYIKAHPDCTNNESMKFSLYYIDDLYQIYLENGNDEVQ